MLTGFNTNIRHRGVLFHVQSEDSGRDHPHVITHLFHGGNIMASEKSGYADRVDDSDLEGVVRAIMEAQHKAVLKRLRAGEFDDVIQARLGDEVFGDETAPPAAVEAAAAVDAPSETTAPPTQQVAAEPPPAAASPEEPPPAVASPEEPPPAVASPEEPPEPDAGRPFGDGIVSDKPLDEVILNYLVSNARKRKRQQAS